MPAPTFANPTSRNVTSNSATLEGVIADRGDVPIAARGIVYDLAAKNPEPRLHVQGVTNLPTGLTGAFAANTPRLEPGRTYAFAAYVVASDGNVFYSPVGQFTTLADANSIDNIWTLITLYIILVMLAVVAVISTVLVSKSLITPFAFILTLVGVGGIAVILACLARRWSPTFGAAPPTAPSDSVPVVIQVFDRMQSWDVAKWVASIANLPVIVFLVIVSMILLVGYFVANNPASNDPTNFARTLITLLFSTGTIAISFIITITAIMRGPDNISPAEFKERFEGAKGVLTVMIGIFGTILGFYFGTATTGRDGEAKLSVVATKMEITLKPGEKDKVNVSLKLDGGKFTGTVRLAATQHEGLDLQFKSDSIKSDGVVELTVSAKADAKETTHIVTILGTLEGGATISPVSIKVIVKK